MPFHRTVQTSATGLLLALCLVTPAVAENLVTIRLQSLESALDDMDRVTGPMASGMNREQLLGSALSMFGLHDAAWLDDSQPVAVVLPQTGMMYGGKGFVAALPISEIGSAFDALEQRFGEPEIDGGVHRYSGDAGELWVRSVDGYFVVGASRSLVDGLDAAAALAPIDGPPGNLQVDVYLEPFAPMIQMGLVTGRQMLDQQMAQSSENDDEAPDPQQLKGIFDLYFNLIRDTVNNTSRLQLSAELGAQDLIFHKRLVPRAGSTLAGMLAVQKGELPALSRYLDATASAVAVGQLTYTPAFLEAARSYMDSYGAFMQNIGAFLEQSPGAGGLGDFFSALSGTMEKSLDCYRGDFGGSWTFDTESGMGAVQIAGMQDSEVCATLISELTQVLKDLPAGSDGKPVVQVTEDALVHGGVRAMRQEVSWEALGLAEADAGQVETMHALIGESLVSYTGQLRDYVLTASGHEAEQAFKDLVGRVSSRRLKKRKGAGVQAELFAPLQVGPGVFGFMNLGQLMRTIGSLAEEAESNPLFDMDDEAGRLVYGARFDGAGLNIEFSVPLAMLEAIGEAAEHEAHPVHGDAVGESARLEPR